MASKYHTEIHDITAHKLFERELSIMDIIAFLRFVAVHSNPIVYDNGRPFHYVIIIADGMGKEITIRFNAVTFRTRVMFDNGFVTRDRTAPLNSAVFAIMGLWNNPNWM